MKLSLNSNLRKAKPEDVGHWMKLASFKYKEQFTAQILEIKNGAVTKAQTGMSGFESRFISNDVYIVR